MPPRAYIFETSTYPYAFRRVKLVDAPRFRPGQKVKLPAELGAATGEIVDCYGANLWQVKIGAQQFVISDHALKPAAPKWRPGDVVIVRWHGPSSAPYTYVRGMYSWPGERSPKTDAQIDELYLAGKATPVLQSGGEPFDKERL